jgi:hypothetical protein
MRIAPVDTRTATRRAFEQQELVSNVALTPQMDYGDSVQRL